MEEPEPELGGAFQTPPILDPFRWTPLLEWGARSSPGGQSSLILPGGPLGVGSLAHKCPELNGVLLFQQRRQEFGDGKG